MSVTGEESSLAIRIRMSILTNIIGSVHDEVSTAQVDVMHVNRDGDTRVHRVHDLATGEGVYVETTVRIITRDEIGN